MTPNQELLTSVKEEDDEYILPGDEISQTNLIALCLELSIIPINGQ